MPRAVEQQNGESAAAPAGSRKHHEKPGWGAVVAVARKHLLEYIALESRVLKGDDIVAIHDFRVASRRLQEALDLLYPQPRSKRLQKLRRRIRRSRRALSDLRNCDVVMQHVKEFSAKSSPAQQHTWTAFEEYLQKRRLDDFQNGVGKLSRINLADLYVRLEESLAATEQSLLKTQPESAADGKAREMHGSLHSRVTHALQLRWKNVSEQLAATESGESGASLHGIRIASKRIRYLIEVIRELKIADTRGMLGHLRRVQSALGDWHDIEVLEQMISEMVARPEFLRKNIKLAIELTRLMLKTEKIKQAYHDRYMRLAASPEGWSALESWMKGFPQSH
jgi:CHAD domain-containing protein